MAQQISVRGLEILYKADLALAEISYYYYLPSMLHNTVHNTVKN